MYACQNNKRNKPYFHQGQNKFEGDVESRSPSANVFIAFNAPP